MLGGRPAALIALHPAAGTREERREGLAQRREFHMTPQREVAPLVIGLVVATGAIAAQYGLRVRGARPERRRRF